MRLVQAADGAQLWSQDYEGDRGDIFDLEEDIAGSIATALKVPASPTEALVRNRTGDFEAYLDFLRAKVAARPRGAKPLADAAVLLEKVVAREPDFAPAAALLAYSYALTPLFAPSLRSGMPQEERKIVEANDPEERCAGAARDAARSEERRSLRRARLRQHGAAAHGGCRGRVPQSDRAQPEPGRWPARPEPASRRARPRRRVAHDARASAGGRAVHHQLHGGYRRDILARRRHREGRRHAPAVPPRPHARARAGARLGRPSPGGRGGAARDAGVELSRRDAGRRRRRFSTPRRRRPRTRRRCRGSAI